MRDLRIIGVVLVALVSAGAAPGAEFGAAGLEPLRYNHPGLVVDLGVGLWAQPMPMDFDGDGDLDLVVSCADVPSNGTYFFENPGGDKMPVFKRAVRIDRGMGNVQVSHVGGQIRVLAPGVEYTDFTKRGFSVPHKLPLGPNIHANKVRANHWRTVDYDGDGRLDLIVGVEDWTEYGWDNAFDAEGRWTRGPLHGLIYLARNTAAAADAEPEYAEPVLLEAAGKPIDTFGMPCPNLADFDADGDLDILCGEFIDKFTYFENTGTRTEPRYAAGRRLTHEGQPIAVHLCMIVPVAIDWDADGDQDLVVGQEDGRVMLLEHTGKIVDGAPAFALPRFFQQEADLVKFGALVTPVGCDWDADGDQDLVCGNTAGEIGFIENLGGFPPKWAAPVLVEADGRPIRIMAGENGSIQGPCEAKWGYTTLSVADWDGDKLADLVVNSIWGKVVWYRNIGTPQAAKFAAARPVEVEWPEKPPKPEWVWWTPEGKSLATEWRTTPAVVDHNADGLNDLVMLDHEGYLAYFERARAGGRLTLKPPARIFRDAKATADKAAEPLRLNSKTAGGSGRRKFTVVDWDQDGQRDLLIDSRSVSFLKNEGELEGGIALRDTGVVDSRRLAGHDTSPTTVDWDGNGVPDLVAGAEDGLFYYLRNPSATKDE